MRRLKPGRSRLMDVEPCHVCHSVVRDQCRDYRGNRKSACWLRAVCHRCAAQPNECRCGVLTSRRAYVWSLGRRQADGQLELFPDAVAGEIRGNR